MSHRQILAKNGIYLTQKLRPHNALPCRRQSFSHLSLWLVTVEARTGRSSGHEIRRHIAASAGRPSIPSPILPPALVFRAPVCSPRPLGKGTGNWAGRTVSED